MRLLYINIGILIQKKTLEFINLNKDTDLKILDKWNGFAIVNKSENILIGDCAIKIEKDFAEIGCNISPIFQKKGFAKEIIQLLIDTCFRRTDVDTIYGITDSNNIASIKLMGALGMLKDNTFEEKILCKEILSTEHKYFLKRQKT